MQYNFSNKETTILSCNFGKHYDVGRTITWALIGLRYQKLRHVLCGWETRLYYFQLHDTIFSLTILTKSCYVTFSIDMGELQSNLSISRKVKWVYYEPSVPTVSFWNWFLSARNCKHGLFWPPRIQARPNGITNKGWLKRMCPSTNVVAKKLWHHPKLLQQNVVKAHGGANE